MKCLNCSKEIEERKINRYYFRKFCSDKCRYNYNSRIRYDKIKSTPEYKTYRKKYFREWIEKNREHYNELMRPHNKLAQEIRRNKFKELGLCRRCGGQIINTKFVSCERCRENERTGRRIKRNGTESGRIITPNI